MRASRFACLLLPALLLPPLAAHAAEGSAKATKSSAARWDIDPHDLSTMNGHQLLVKSGFVARFNEAERAAKAGDPIAATLLSLAYSSGTGIEADKYRAFEYAERAAKGGSGRGMNAYGVLLADRGDHNAAFTWLKRAADAGNAIGMASLGNAYAKGQGVTADPEEALRWYRRSADQGAPVGMVRLANAYSAGAGIPRDDATAVGWARKAAELGDPIADQMMGEFYLAGRGVQPDPVQAKAWMQRAADKGNATARARLAAIEAQQQQAAAAAEQARIAAAQAAEDDDDDDDALGMLAGVALGAMASNGNMGAQIAQQALSQAAPSVAAGAQLGNMVGGAGRGSAIMPDLGAAPGGFVVPGYGANKAPATVANASGGKFAKKPNTLLGSAACRGYTNENYQQYFQQHSTGPDVQLHSLCAGAFNYYHMYENAIRQGYSEADCDRTYKAFSDAALVATDFYRTAR